MVEDQNNYSFNNIQLSVLKQYEEILRLKNYSINTITVYRSWFNLFLKYFPEHIPSAITKVEIIEFLTFLKNKNNLSATSQNQLISAIKFFFEKTL